MHYLYRITNILNNKVYIGQTIRPQGRWYDHRRSAAYPSTMVITRAIKKYGAHNFEFEVIACCQTQEDANIVEVELILQYSSRNADKGYNIALGGLGHRFSEETRKKISEKLKGRISPRKGVKLSIETIEKIRLANLGKKRTVEQKMRMSLARKGKRRISSNKEQMIIQLYQNGDTYSEIIKKTGCCEKTITRVMRRNDRTTRQLKFSPEQVAHIRKRRQQGITLAHIAKQYNITLQRVFLMTNDIGACKNRKFSEEHKQKLAQAKLGKHWKIISGKRVWY